MALLRPEPWRRPSAEELVGQAFLGAVPFQRRLPADVLLAGFPLPRHSPHHQPTAEDAASVHVSSAQSLRPPTIGIDLPINYHLFIAFLNLNDSVSLITFFDFFPIILPFVSNHGTNLPALMQSMVSIDGP